MKTAFSTILSLPLLLPFLGGGHELSRTGLEQALGKQMNAGRTVPITKSVDCRHAGGSKRYLCVLTGARGTKATAYVTVTDGTWRAEWSPLKG
jgi:hypothetical protein